MVKRKYLVLIRLLKLCDIAFIVLNVGFVPNSGLGDRVVCLIEARVDVVGSNLFLGCEKV